MEQPPVSLLEHRANQRGVISHSNVNLVCLVLLSSGFNLLVWLLVLGYGILCLEPRSQLFDYNLVSLDRLCRLFVNADALHRAETVICRVLVTPV